MILLSEITYVGKVMAISGTFRAILWRAQDGHMAYHLINCDTKIPMHTFSFINLKWPQFVFAPIVVKQTSVLNNVDIFLTCNTTFCVLVNTLVSSHIR